MKPNSFYWRKVRWLPTVIENDQPNHRLQSLLFQRNIMDSSCSYNYSLLEYNNQGYERLNMVTYQLTMHVASRHYRMLSRFRYQNWEKRFCKVFSRKHLNQRSFLEVLSSVTEPSCTKLELFPMNRVKEGRSV